MCSGKRVEGSDHTGGPGPWPNTEGFSTLPELCGFSAFVNAALPVHANIQALVGALLTRTAF